MATEMLRHLLFAYLCIVAHTILVHAQLQAGFISLDCGISEDSDYTDQKTNINYVSDESFIETGVRKKVSPEYVTETSERQFLNLRSFPEGTKNCYSIKLSRNYDKFFIRARFLYGNYDGQNKPPKFDLLLEADKWDSVEFKDASTIVTKEVIHAPQRNYIFVCLVNTGSGTPFMSTLEFRPLRNLTYQTQSGSLQLFGRFDVGSTSNETIRYEDDNYDRIWFPFSFDNWAPINSSLTVGYSKSDYQLPSSVMSTAVIPANDSNSIEFFWEPLDPKSQYYIYLHFAEIADARANNQTRELNISLNGNLWYGPFVPDYLYTSTIFSVSPISGDVIQFSIAKTVNSTLPPILNALEIYQIKEFMQSLTKQQDVDAIMNAKSDYNLKRNWQGDPCAPTVHMWQGLNCSYNGTESPRIISLNLSSSGLTREISAYISNLTSIRILDLSKNNLTGQVPEFLAKLPFLSVLDLKGNKLQGPIPAGLLIKKKNGQLSLSVDPDLCSSASCTEQHKHIVPIVAAFGSLSALLTAIAVFWILKKRKQEDKWWLSILIVIGVALLVPLLFYLCYLIWRKLKAKVDVTMNRKKLLRELEDDVSSLNTNGKGVTQEKDQSMKHELKIFNFQTIVAATNNFSTANELGKGGFGPVYKGKLLGGEEIAIKRLSKSSGQGVEEFKNEAKLIAKLQHTNLVRLLGCSLQGEERILVYEFMPNKSLDFFIFDSKRKNLLNWKKRFNIIEGIAQGLLYLHKYSRLRVIHRDLKASNILLDDQMNPKISDFGMARIFRVNESEGNTNRIVGTFGYMSPEYAMNGIVSIKTDVFSFGVLVLEIVSGKKNNSCYHIRHPLNLVGYAWQLVNEGKGLELKDPTMDEACSPSEVLRCIHVGLLCVQDQATDRPTMSDVVSMLTNEAVTLPAPKQPAFFVNVTAEEPEISRNRLDSCSVNDVTISAMKAR